jgi:hypothetical protein
MSIFLATWRAEIRRIMVQDHTRQKVSETPSQSISGCSGLTFLTPESRSIMVPGQLRGKKICKIPSQWKKADSSDFRKCKIGRSWSKLARAKSKTLSPKQPEPKGLTLWLKQYNTYQV